jgi:hypothetical protein
MGVKVSGWGGVCVCFLKGFRDKHRFERRPFCCPLKKAFDMMAIMPYEPPGWADLGRPGGFLIINEPVLEYLHMM